MKYQVLHAVIEAGRRAPRGACGLKYFITQKKRRCLGRAPRGACGLKYSPATGTYPGNSRAPRGACGLKFGKMLGKLMRGKSGPARGLWIEILPTW